MRLTRHCALLTFLRIDKCTTGYDPPICPIVKDGTRDGGEKLEPPPVEPPPVEPPPVEPPPVEPPPVAASSARLERDARPPPVEPPGVAWRLAHESPVLVMDLE